MTDVTRSKVRAPRSQQALPDGTVLSRSFDRWANAIAVRSTGKGSPDYIEDTTAGRFVTFDLTAAVDPPTTTAPSPSQIVDLSAFSDACVTWLVGTGAYADLDLEFWVFAPGPGWLKLESQDRASVPPSVELLVQGVGYRGLFVRPSDKGAGADGTVTIWVAGT